MHTVCSEQSRTRFVFTAMIGFGDVKNVKPLVEAPSHAELLLIPAKFTLEMMSGKVQLVTGTQYVELNPCSWAIAVS